MIATAVSPPPRRSPLAARLAAAATALGVATSIFSSAVAAASPTVPLPGFWMPNGNDSLLLNAEAVTALTGLSGMKVSGVSSQFADGSRRVSPATCAGLYQPAEATAYPAATNVTSVSMDDEKDEVAGHLVQQSVIGYADSASARAQFGEVSNTWARCAGQALTARSQTGKTKNWTVGLPTPTSGDELRVVTNLGPGGVCERALTVRAAIIVDVMACALGGGSNPAGPGPATAAAGQAEAIAAAVRDNVAHRDH